MKKIVSFLLTGLSIISVARAQDRIQADACSGKQFVYTFVDQNCGIAYFCSSDPYGSPPAGYHVISWQTGFNLTYSTTNLNLPCVDQTAYDDCVDRAFCAWTSLTSCSGGVLSPYRLTAQRVPANSSDHGIMPIIGSSDANVFGGTGNLAVAHAVTYNAYGCGGNWMNYGIDSHGHVHQTYIAVNTSDVYTQSHTLVYPCDKNNLKSGCTNNPIDLCDVITHEIGHSLMGPTHTSGNQPTGAPNDCPGGNHSSQDIMYYASGNQINECNGKFPQFTDNDCCMIHNLYCYGQLPYNCPPSFSCDNSGVNEGSMVPRFNPNLSAFPNPTTGLLTIEFSSDRPGMVTAGIFDMLGHQLITASYREQPGRDSHIMDLSTLPAGHYIVRVLGANLRGSRMIKLSSK